VLEAAELLKDHLDVTVLIKRRRHRAGRVTEFPVVKAVSARPRANSARSS